MIESTARGRRRGLFALLLLLTACRTFAQASVDDLELDRRYPFENLARLEALFERLDYTEENWRDARVVPRVYLTEVPRRWGARTAPQLPVAAKKSAFFRTILPLVLSANERLLDDRQRLLAFAQDPDAHASMPAERAWLASMAAAYRVPVEDPGAPPPAAFRELLHRVDLIPTSLALAQAAEESGWGTSRFAGEGNALFGQWSWSADAMTPTEMRSELGHYGLAAFESPLASVVAYMHNLNTHAAYEPLRTLRAQTRARGEVPDGASLAGGLLRYSERGPAYVEDLRTIMRVNDLAAVDDARLSLADPLFAVPVEAE